MVTWNYFPDGWPNISFEHPSKLQGRHVVFLGSLYDRTKFVEQLSVVMILPRQFVRSLSIVFPYFAPGTMERVDEEGIVATAETVAKLFASAIPMTKNGPASLRVRSDLCIAFAHEEWD
jgi:phosphoribosylpyrophosphate synthetase